MTELPTPGSVVKTDPKHAAVLVLWVKSGLNARGAPTTLLQVLAYNGRPYTWDADAYGCRKLFFVRRA